MILQKELVTGKYSSATDSKMPSESLTQYAQALKRLVGKAYPNLQSTAQEQFVLDQFSLGLPNHEIKRHVQFGHPKNLNEALSLSIEYEAFESGNKDRLKKPQGSQYKTGEVFAFSDANQTSYRDQKRSRENIRVFLLSREGALQIRMS